MILHAVLFIKANNKNRPSEKLYVHIFSTNYIGLTQNKYLKTGDFISVQQPKPCTVQQILIRTFCGVNCQFQTLVNIIVHYHTVISVS